MQYILALVGSPRKRGNTALMVDELLLNVNEEVFTNDIVFLGDKSIGPCTDCRACTKGKLVCTVNDEMQELYQKMEAADVLVFGTPIYWYSCSAQIKLLIDRLRPFYRNEKLKGKKAILLLPAGSGSGDCDLTIEMFKRTFKALQIGYVGVATAKAFDEGDVMNDKNALEEIKVLASKI